MKKKTILVLVLVLLFLVLLTNGLQGQETKQEITTFSFTTGNQYLNLTEGEKLDYVRGSIDVFLVVTKHYNSEDYSNLEETVDNMTLGQIKAIFDKYLEKHLEKWHYGAAGLFFGAIWEIVNEKKSKYY